MPTPTTAAVTPTHSKPPLFAKLSELTTIRPTKRALLPLLPPIHPSKRRRPLELIPGCLNPSSGHDIPVIVKTSLAAPAVGYMLKDEVLGYLLFEQDGKSKAIIITANTSFTIGRRYDCDLAIPSPLISKSHLRLFAIIIDSSESSPLICLTDSSSNGFKHNGLHRKGRQSVVLIDGDVIELPGTKWVFRFSAKREEDLEPAKKFIGGYTLLHKKLGSGGNGIVQLAEDSITRRQVACKMIKMTQRVIGSNDRLQTLREQLLREIKIGRQVDHANVIKVLAEEDVGGEKYIFVELLVGGDLFAYIEKHGSLLELEAKFFAFQLMRGLKYLHDHNIAHCDIKTENILLAPRAGTFPRLVIADFGHAIETGDDQIYLQVRGTMSHLCPEEVIVLLGRCQAGYDPKMADVWSLAIVIYKCLLATEPFEPDFYSVSGAVSCATSAYRSQANVESESRSRADFRDHRGLQAILTLEPAYQPRAVWARVSEAGKDFMHGMLQRMLEQRWTLKQAVDSVWISLHREELDKLYEAIVKW